MRVRSGFVVVWMCGVVVCVGARAAQPESADAPVCAEVTVNGVRAPSFECLTRKLQPSPQLRPQGADDAQPGLASEGIVLRPSNQLGLFNRAATGTRMGNTFGTSVYPQRPPQVQPSLPPGTR